jgi:membrane fusion protein, copper/silver efflux system
MPRRSTPVTRNRFRGAAISTAAFALIAFVGLTLTACKDSAASGGKKYHCPMHPTYVSDKPGDCPICNMKLVPIKDDKATKTSGKPASTNTLASIPIGKYYCPMFCDNTVSDTPGKCPVCGMKLKQKTAADTTNTTHTAHAPETASNVAGRTAVTISADRQQLIGLRTAQVEKRRLSTTIRTTAAIEHDETRLVKIAPRFAGWVRELHVNFTGQHVEKGAPLFTVYSPELLSAESEYLLAHRRVQQLKADDPQREAAQRLATSARRRLELWQIGDEEIRAIEQRGEPKDELLVRAPVSGHVTAKAAVQGKAFMSGETLYEIADLSHLWLRASVYEFELPLVRTGQTARVILPYLGNKTYESVVTFIYPHIEQQTRRAEIRLELNNPKHELRPQMWANVEIDANHGEILSIPADAVIDTGERYVAFVKHGDHLEPRDVKIGVKTDDVYEVRGGLSEGDVVVTRALFLVDSESQLKAAISGMGASGEHNH